MLALGERSGIQRTEVKPRCRGLVTDRKRDLASSSMIRNRHSEGGCIRRCRNTKAVSARACGVAVKQATRVALNFVSCSAAPDRAEMRTNHAQVAAVRVSQDVEGVLARAHQFGTFDLSREKDLRDRISDAWHRSGCVVEVSWLGMLRSPASSADLSHQRRISVGGPRNHATGTA